VLAVSAVVTPILLTQLGGGGVASAAALPNTSNFDEIQYNQDTGNAHAYYSFVPWSGSTAPTAGKTTTQSMTGGGGCSPGPNFPGLPPTPLLDVTGQANGAPANVAAFKFRTGVCPGNSGQNQLITANEGLTFGLGTGNDAIIGKNRSFADAQIVVARQDSNTDTATANLIESSAGSQVGEQQIQIPSGTANWVLDTGCGTLVASSQGNPAPCSGANTKLFDQVQFVLTGLATDAVSVVPTSIFYLSKTLCEGDTVSVTSTDGTATSGQVSASVTLQGTDKTVCKSYVLFSASANDPKIIQGNVSTKTVKFDSQPLAGSHFTVKVDWGTDPYCRPDVDGAQTTGPGTVGTPTCLPTWVSTNGGPYQPQTYCSSATAADPLCTTSRKFAYVPVTAGDPDNDGDLAFENDGWDGPVDAAGGPTSDGNTAVDITETWDGVTDWGMGN
jgi:hypothetical protein